jgi:alkanesulfonate monooxygenase SsuD/methylene tetrahydromethanopterin reductase-like flavin-dependent oxidoreductase (luciferase family)
MKIGIFLTNQNPPGSDMVAALESQYVMTRFARDHGWDAVATGQHYLTEGAAQLQLIPFLARLHAEAGGMIGIAGVLLAGLHNPVEVAETIASLDVVWGGNLVFGVGLGYRPEEFAAFGVPLAERASRLTEGVEIIRRLWTEDRVTHQGRHWQFSDASIRPRPLQSPRPPILIGAQVEAAIKRAARIGDGWLLVPTPTMDKLAEQMALYKSARAAAKLPLPEHICRLYEVGCAESEDAAFRRVAPYLLEKYAAYASWGLGGVAQDRSGAPEEQLRRLAKDRFAIGTPAQVTDALVAQHRAGVTHLAMRVSWPGMGQDDILASIELIGRSVLPEVRRRIFGGGEQRP